MFIAFDRICMSLVNDIVEICSMCMFIIWFCSLHASSCTDVSFLTSNIFKHIQSELCLMHFDAFNRLVCLFASCLLHRTLRPWKHNWQAWRRWQFYMRESHWNRCQSVSTSGWHLFENAFGQVIPVLSQYNTDFERMLRKERWCWNRGGRMITTPCSTTCARKKWNTWRVIGWQARRRPMRRVPKHSHSRRLSLKTSRLLDHVPESVQNLFRICSESVQSRLDCCKSGCPPLIFKWIVSVVLNQDQVEFNRH